MPLKILLADDSMTAQSMGKKILADAGYEVVAVSNGAAAMKKLAEFKPDIVLLDVYMPGYSGLEVCEKIKNGPPSGQIPVLLTVGKMEPFKVEEGIKAKADGLIIKPFEATDLITVVGKLALFVRPQEALPEPVAAAPAPIEEFQVPVAAPQAPADAGFNMGAPAMLLDLLEESPAAATQPTVITTAPEKANDVAGPRLRQLSPMESSVPEPAMASAPAVSMQELQAAVAQMSPALAAEASPAEEPFVIELPTEFLSTADHTAAAPAAVVPEQAAAPVPEPAASAVQPVASDEIKLELVNEAPCPEITLEAVSESDSDITLDFADETAALDALAGSPTLIAPLPAAPSAPQAAVPGWQVEPSTVEPLAVEQHVVEPQIVEPQIVGARVQPTSEADQVAGALETFEIHLEPIGAAPEPALEVTAAPPVGEVAPDHELMFEREPVDIEIKPEPMLVGHENVEVTTDSALITDIHDLSSYASIPAPTAPEDDDDIPPLGSEPVITPADAVVHPEEAQPAPEHTELPEDQPAPAHDATVISDLPDAPAVVAVLAEQTRYPELAEESPEFVLFGADAGTEAEVQCEARLSAALDAYDQTPEPAPERVFAQGVAIAVPAADVASPIVESMPEVAQAAERVFAAAAASDVAPDSPLQSEKPLAPEHEIASAPALPVTLQAVPAAAAVSSTPPPQRLEQLVASIVDNVIERLKPEILSEIERRRAELIAEITKELKH